MNVETEISTKNFILSSTKAKSCRGKLHRHLKGMRLQILTTLLWLANRHGGIAWPSPAWFEENGFCSSFWARQCLKELEKDGWIASTEWHGRDAYIVRSHAEWARQSQSECCSLVKSTETELRDSQQSCEKSNGVAKKATKLRGAAWENDLNSLENEAVTRRAAAPKEELRNNEGREEGRENYASTPTFFLTAYRQKYPARTLNLKKFRKPITDLVEAHGPEAMTAAYHMYLADDAQWLREHFHPFGTFVNQAAEWVEKSSVTLAEERDAERKYPMVEFEGRMMPVFVVDQIVKEREEGQRRIEEKEREEELGREEVEYTKLHGF
jgi:hypothetical protein